MNYKFSHESNEAIRTAWNDAKDREVVAVLEMGCADIELMIEREPNNSVILSTFCCLKFEETGWESDDYVDVDVQDKVSKFASWEQVEQYMKEELIKYCKKNNVDYTKDTLDLNS